MFVMDPVKVIIIVDCFPPGMYYPLYEHYNCLLSKQCTYTESEKSTFLYISGVCDHKAVL